MASGGISEIFQDILVSLLSTGVLAAAARSTLGRWIERRVDAGVEEGLTKRLAAHQLSLDKDLERYRTLLSHESDRIRALLQKEGVDYGIYAQRRHDAISGLFEELLRLETVVTDFSDLRLRSADQLELSQLTPLTFRLDMIPEQQNVVQNAFASKDFSVVDKALAEAREQAITNRVISARNEASEAYYRAALYLPDSVDFAAIEVKEHFHMMTIPYVAPSTRRGLEMHENKNKLRSLMLAFQGRARAELGGAAAKSSVTIASPDAPRVG